MDFSTLIACNQQYKNSAYELTLEKKLIGIERTNKQTKEYRTEDDES